ncbi:Hypothetical predicted protein [Mytilus galloprovincialis]|uniref:Reverse transcriptase/retrotransposon-derived protein RNase H-like domain-containing protein n=1 Tax=Mytilus galloprovincialis TaxID=29158 RepID=A0A8B6G0M9_MYTGA|nr:Hypothetical predicted protein [Mytilus galloprovincialis]
MFKATGKPTKPGKTPLNYSKEAEHHKLDTAFHQSNILPEEEQFVLKYRFENRIPEREDTTIPFVKNPWTLPSQYSDQPTGPVPDHNTVHTFKCLNSNQAFTTNTTPSHFSSNTAPAAIAIVTAATTVPSLHLQSQISTTSAPPPATTTSTASAAISAGHIISKEGIPVDTSKAKAVETFPIPNNQHDVRSFLGLCNYYRKFVKGYAKIASPLNRLLSKDSPIKLTSDCKKAFETLKTALTSTPVLKFPNFNKPFIISCDASGSAICYILSQFGEDKKEHVIGYGGRALSPAENKYTVTEQEMLALVSAVAYFHVYLTSNKFTVERSQSTILVTNY